MFQARRKLIQKRDSSSARTSSRLITAHLVMLFLLTHRMGTPNARNIHDLFGYITAPSQTHIHVTRAYLYHRDIPRFASTATMSAVCNVTCFFYLTGPCTAWNLTIHEYRKNGDPAGIRLHTFCSRDTHKNFTLPWKMNTVVVR